MTRGNKATKVALDITAAACLLAGAYLVVTPAQADEPSPVTPVQVPIQPAPTTDSETRGCDSCVRI